MNPFARMMKDEILIENSAGERQGPFKTAFNNKSISIFDTSLVVTEGDTVIRTLPNQQIETYTITEVSFSSGLASIPSHYALKLLKDTAIRHPRAQSTTNHITINNSQGIQIGDHNIQHLQAALSEVLQRIDAMEAPREQREEAKTKLAQFLAHPLVSTVVGASLPTALGLLS